MQNTRRHLSPLSTAFAALLLASALLLPAAITATTHPLPHDIRAKLSPQLRTLLTKNDGSPRSTPSAAKAENELRVCAFVQVADSNADVLTASGCRILAQWGDIFIADMPLSRIEGIAAGPSVCRIEAERGGSVTLDSMSIFTNATPVYEGEHLPQAFTGRGVVMGIQDIGFDLTHPTFYSADGSTYRIKRLWDMLSPQADGNAMYVGAEYAGEEALLAHSHSHDGTTQWHGTHTLGIAAGSGAGSRYKGMAPESDICLVSNAVSGDEEYIDSADYYRYTHATDALGFKYIFDYAQSQGKPCVISFSEGSVQTLRDDDLLYYEALRRMTGKGRIIVSSAGNRGTMRNYVHKPQGRASAGTFCIAGGTQFAAAMQSDAPTTVRAILYNVGNASFTSPRVTTNGANVVINLSTADVTAAADSCISDTLIADGKRWVFTAEAYPSSSGRGLLGMDITVDGPRYLGFNTPLSLELVGAESDAEMFCQSGEMRGDAANPEIDDAESSHNINSPASAPAVICVGGTACRPTYTNIDGDTISQWWGASGGRGTYSSVGPTFDGRMKPEVMAPGANIVSALNRAYNEQHPDELRQWTVAEQTFRGQRYGWVSTGGTSMASPAVGGIIALWLQACPTLSPTDVLGVIARTSKPCGDYGPMPNNFCGYGMIDAYAGLLDVLGLTGIQDLSATAASGVRVRVGHGGVLHLCFDEAPTVGAVFTLYDLQGRRLMQTRLDSEAKEHRIATGAPAGVYAIQIDSADRQARGSMLVRLE